MAGKGNITPLGEEQLGLISGGNTLIAQNCSSHDWVYTGSHTDNIQQVTWNYYKCSRCGAEKTERS